MAAGLWGPGVPKCQSPKCGRGSCRGAGKLEGTQRAGWECRGPTIFNISIKVFMGLTEPAVNPATSCQFHEYFYRDAGMAPGWPEAKIWTQCAWHDHGEQIDSEGPLLLGKFWWGAFGTPGGALKNHGVTVCVFIWWISFDCTLAMLVLLWLMQMQTQNNIKTSYKKSYEQII